MELTSEEMRLYDFLKERSEKGEWTKMHTLSVVFNVNERTIRKFIENIRNCDSIDNIIVSGNSGYKVMTRKEESQYLVKRKIKILKELKLYNKDVNRLIHNGQYRFDFESEDESIYTSLLIEN